MSLPILTKVYVIEKEKGSFDADDGKKIDYFNLTVIENKEDYYPMKITVPEEVFNQIKEKEEVKLKGIIGKKDGKKYWSFKEVIK